VSIELSIAYSAAFLSLALFAVTLGGIMRRLTRRHEDLWVRARRYSASPIAAIVNFSRQVLATEGLKLDSIGRLRSKLKTDVVKANSDLTAEEYLGKTLLEGLLVLAVGAAVCMALFGIWSLLIPAVLAAAWVFWISPSLVEADGEKRSRAIYRRIPYTLDLMVLTLQAGGTLREGLVVASTGSDPLAAEIRAALTEMDSGASQSAALANLSRRVGVPALDSIVIAINRGLETGAPMVQTLTTQAELFRERRLQELEKLAVEAPTKMTFPNMMVMLSVLIIVIGPVLVRIATSGML
jgi:tight adherence protein C